MGSYFLKFVKTAPGLCWNVNQFAPSPIVTKRLQQNENNKVEILIHLHPGQFSSLLLSERWWLLLMVPTVDRWDKLLGETLGADGDEDDHVDHMMIIWWSYDDHMMTMIVIWWSLWWWLRWWIMTTGWTAGQWGRLICEPGFPRLPIWLLVEVTFHRKWVREPDNVWPSPSPWVTSDQPWSKFDSTGNWLRRRLK